MGGTWGGGGPWDSSRPWEYSGDSRPDEYGWNHATPSYDTWGPTGTWVNGSVISATSHPDTWTDSWYDHWSDSYPTDRPDSGHWGGSWEDSWENSWEVDSGEYGSESQGIPDDWWLMPRSKRVCRPYESREWSSWSTSKSKSKSHSKSKSNSKSKSKSKSHSKSKSKSNSKSKTQTHSKSKSKSTRSHSGSWDASWSWESHEQDCYDVEVPAICLRSYGYPMRYMLETTADGEYTGAVIRLENEPCPYNVDLVGKLCA